MDSNQKKTQDEKIVKFLDTLTWYYGSKDTPTGLYSTIGRIDEKLGQFITTLQKADESSTKLTKALNNITIAGVVVAVLGLLVAAGNLFFEIYKYLQPVLNK